MLIPGGNPLLFLLAIAIIRVKEIFDEAKKTAAYVVGSLTSKFFGS